MNLFLRVDINVIAFIMLLLVYLVAYHQLEKHDSLSKVFMTASVIILLQLFLETATCIINKRPEPWLIPITNLLHMLLFSIGPIATCYWYFLIRGIIRPAKKRFKKRDLVFWLPVGINFILNVLSPVYYYIFYIDSSNVYHRGKLYMLSIGIAYFYIIYALLLILLQRKSIPKEDANILMIFIGFPVCGGLIQAFIYGPLLIWSCSAFSLVVVYIFLQQRMIHVDELTGAWDRGSFEYYLRNRLSREQEGFGIIYCDIDHLKEINDSYGHREGDYAISTAVSLIRKAIHQEDIVVRHGGDEFLIVVKSPFKKELIATIGRMELIFDEFNKDSAKRYKLECSFGGDIYDNSHSSIDQFIHYIDGLMYQNKNEKKQKELQYLKEN